jgi:hypothetical protein
MQVVDKYGNTFGQGHLVITTKSGKSKLPVVTVAWGNITGVLANQTDLQDALDLKVPTSRTLTINGVTQDLSADRTWTISTGITVNTTPITGGTSGRLLFDNAGTVGETDGAHWDTSGFLGIGTTIPVAPIGYNGITINSTTGAYTWFQTGGVTKYSIGTEGNVNYHNLVAGTSFLIRSGGNNYFNLVQSTGNVQIGTTTDAGFKLDVNGSVTFRGELRLNANIATGGNRNYLLGNSGDFEVTTNTTIKFRNFYNASDVYFSMNYGTGGRALFSGLTSATGYRLSTSGNVVPETAVARGVYFNNTLTASANNDVLVGLDISPTYTLGAFTGVYGVDLRTKNAGVVIGSGYGYGALYGYANDGIVQVVDGGTSSLSGGTYASQIWLRPAGNSGGLNSNYWATLEQSTGGLFIQSGRYNSNIVIKTGRAGTSGNIYFNNAGGTMTMFFGATANLGIGTTTDAGYKLDVNGTARVQNAFTIASSVFNVLSTSSSLFFVDTGSNNYRIANFIGYGGYHPGSGTNNTGDIFSVGANPSSSANGTSFFRLNYNGGNSSGIYGSSGNNVSLAQLNATTLSRLYLTAQGSGLLLQGGTSGNSIISTVADGDNLNLRSEKGTGGGGGGINYLSSINGSNHSHRFFHNNVEQMRLQYSGNLLIGTTTDAGFRLDVNGTAKVNEIVVDNGVANTRTRLTDSALQFSRLSDGTYNPSISRLQSAGGLLYEGYDGGHKFIRGGTVLAHIDVSNRGYSGSGYLGVTNIATRNIFTGGNDSLSLYSDAASGSADGIIFDRGTRSVTAVHSITTWKAAGVEKGRFTQGGSLLINTTTDVPSAIVNVNSTTQGFLPPRMTNTEMLAIATPAEGLVVYDLTNRKLCCYDGATWQPLF